MTAGGIVCGGIFTPALYFLPKATRSTIIVAISSLLDWQAIREAWQYDKADFTAIAATITMTLGFGVEVGVIAGVATSIGLHLHRTMRPHFAIVGAVPGTEHYRNVQRHDVVTHNNILSIRVDESLYFANSAFLEDLVYSEVEKQGGGARGLDVPGNKPIDLSALEALQEINRRLLAADIKLHLSEVKGPVMDALQRSHFLDKLAGKVSESSCGGTGAGAGMKTGTAKSVKWLVTAVACVLVTYALYQATRKRQTPASSSCPHIADAGPDQAALVDNALLMRPQCDEVDRD